MSRKSRIEPIRAFLKKARDDTLAKLYKEINVKNFPQAEVYNRFIDDILAPAIVLCGGRK